MATTDLYGLQASGLPPDLAAQLVGLQGRQAIAQALMQQSLEPLQAPINKGDLTSHISPFAALAKVLQAPLAQMGVDKANKGYADLAAEAVKRRGQALQDYEQQRDGAPSQPPLTPNDDEGNAMPSVAGTKGNARAAIMQAMLNPMLASNPVVQADMKKMEPNWKVEEGFNEKTGRKEKMLVNMNDPTQRVPFGGQQQAKMVATETIDPVTKMPVTKFVDPNAQTEALPKPVKMEMVNTGKVQVPVNPFAPEPLANTTSPNSDQSAGVAIRGQNLHRQTSLEVAGLDENGLPTGDIKTIAQAIADKKMPMLSAFALSRPRGQQIASMVYQIDPNYDVKDFHAADKTAKDFSTGKQGNSVRSFNVALSHLDTLGTLADAMNNGDMQLVNKVGNAVAAQTGNAAPTSFEAARQIVGDEIVKAIVGSGGGVADREKAQKTISQASSPAQLRGVINTYKELMRGQLGGLKQQYEQNTGRKDFDRFLSPEGQAAAHGASNVMRFDAQGNPIP